MPKKVEKLKKMLYNWRSKVNAQILTPNPNYDSRKAKKSGMRKKGWKAERAPVQAVM